MHETAEDRIQALGIWTNSIDIAPLSGGITNRNYLVTDAARRYVVRLGEDIDAHLISRAHELAASRAAHAAGVSPAVVHQAPGLLVLDYIESRTLSAADIRAPAMLARILPLLKRCHDEIPKHFRGPAMIFWVFHVIRDYAARLQDRDSLHLPKLPGLLAQAALLEKAAGPFEMVFGHNDLLCGNFLDDGRRLWLIDWDYAGFNTPLFDLGGLASNNELPEADERWLLAAYDDAPLSGERWRRYQAMKCASLLREAMWSMVSEIFSVIDFNYEAYTAENLARFESAYIEFLES